MVLGDLHGDVRAGTDAVRTAKNLGITTIMQVGDFGYWPHFTDGIEFLDSLNAELRRTQSKLYWVDGNHENFDALEAAMQHYPKDKHGRLWIRSHIRWCSRGAAWTWNHKRFMTVGGAVSVDKERRMKMEQEKGQKVWWPQEQLNDNELIFAINKARIKPVDYLFTHDCPTNAPFRGRLKDDPESHLHRQKMDILGKAVRPRMWFHGHMHTRYDAYDFPTYESTTKVYGVECNPDAMHGYQTGAHWGVLDTNTDEFTFGPDALVKHYTS